MLLNWGVVHFIDVFLYSYKDYAVKKIRQKDGLFYYIN